MRDVLPPRGIAVVDIGFTNSKVILYDANLQHISERKIPSPHHQGEHYKEIDVAPIIAFAKAALRELDRVLPIDAIVTSAHGACIVCLDEAGHITVPVMDYTSEPPHDIVAAYQKHMPSYDESYSPPLPMALLHGMQLFWQQSILPESFARTKTILPLMQYIAFALGGRATTEVSSMSCQSHLVDMRSGEASSLAKTFGWDKLYAPVAKAWDVIGTFSQVNRGDDFQGLGQILAGVHDSNANFLRYLAAGQSHFTLLSTGTWIIGFDTDADMLTLDPARDIVANKSVFGKTIACLRFFGGKEFEIIAGEAADANATAEDIRHLVSHGTMALPSFTDSGGPMPNTGGHGRIIGPLPASDSAQVSLASLYCALMVAESLDAISSQGAVIVDGPFSQNQVFLEILSALRPQQTVMASEARDGTAAGAACLALMPDGKLPTVPVHLRAISPMSCEGLTAYQQAWRVKATMAFTP
jgi:sugar (pentulose or hexulose) kinase